MWTVIKSTINSWSVHLRHTWSIFKHKSRQFKSKFDRCFGGLPLLQHNCVQTSFIRLQTDMNKRNSLAFGEIRLLYCWLLDKKNNNVRVRYEAQPRRHFSSYLDQLGSKKVKTSSFQHYHSNTSILYSSLHKFHKFQVENLPPLSV